MEQNPIYVIDDDQDDLDMIEDAAKQLNIGRPIYFFQSGNELVHRLRTEPVAPFLILSDVNLPDETGFDIRKRIQEDAVLKYKSVPFIFWSTGASEKQIQYAYDLPVQGFFFKPSKFSELCKTLETIVNYWQQSQHPKQVN